MNEYKSHAMKTWAVEERPREKVMANGIQILSDVELLAILLGSGTKNMTAVELARQVLKKAGNNLHGLGRQNIGDLLKIKGIGPAKAISVLAALELGRRRNGLNQQEKIPVRSSETVFNLFYPLLGGPRGVLAAYAQQGKQGTGQIQGESGRTFGNGHRYQDHFEEGS